MSPDRSTIVRAPEDGRAAAPASPAIVGYIDKVDGVRVSGWAWDRNQPDVAVDVEIRVAGKAVATVRADRLRKDLARSGTGNGYHAFDAVLETPIAEADRALVSAIASVEGQPGSIALANRAAEPPTLEATATVVSPPPEQQRLLSDLGLVRKAFEDTLKVAAQDIREAVRGRTLPATTDGAAAAASPEPGIAAALEELRARQEELAKQMAALEVFHARFDTALRKLERPQLEAAEQPDSTKGLRITVVIVAMLSLLSLGVGLYSVLM
jgi:hypothetical protein